MIAVTITRQADGKISSYRVSGHSGTADRGEDVVCAGVSALAQAALLGVGEHLHRDSDYAVLASGDLRMSLKGAPDDLTQAILETMRLGLVEIAKASPGALRVDTEQLR